jgi:hypothetical protein
MKMTLLPLQKDDLIRIRSERRSAGVRSRIPSKLCLVRDRPG